MRQVLVWVLLLAATASAQAKRSVGIGPERINGHRALNCVREIVAFGTRTPGSEGMKRQQNYIKQKLKGDTVEEDAFTAETPVDKVDMKNLIAKYPGSTNDIIVIASHYDTLSSVKNFVGANDGASSSALLLELANHLRGKRTGPAVWLVWFDGEEAYKQWSDTDSTYGSRHLAAKWKADGTAKRIKAFLLLDMIGDADLNIDQDQNSAEWLSKLVYDSATKLSVQSHFYARRTAIEDDHLPFAKIGVPVVDIIDLEYGYANAFWHTPNDTVDKLSANSLQIVGDVVLETVRALSK